jgi:hypothetical protein
MDDHIQYFCFWRWSEIQHGCQGPSNLFCGFRKKDENVKFP